MESNPAENEHKSLLRAATDAVTPAQFQEEAYQITAGTLKALGTFTPGRFGFFASAAIFAADEVKTDDQNWFLDASLGAGKGVLTRSLTTRAIGSGMNPALAAIAISTGSRGIDSALTAKNWDDGFGGALGNVRDSMFNRQAMVSDAVVGAISFPLMKAAGGYFNGNPFRQTAAVGFISGYTGGLYEELHRESAKGELDPTRLAVYPFARAVSSAVAAMPGAQRNYVSEYPWKQASVTRDMEYKMVSISAEDVAKITRAGNEVSVRPMLTDGTLGTAETVRIQKQTVPQDWITAAVNSLKPGRAALPPEQLRYMSRAAGAAEDAPWNMVIQPGLKTLPEAVKAAPGNYYAKDEVLPKVRTFVEPTVKYMGSGAESGAFLLANGTVLKLSREFGSVAKETADYGTSPLDARMPAKPVSLGKIDRYDELAAYTQEYVKAPVTEAQAAALRDAAPKHGWNFTDYNYHLQGEQVSWATDQAGRTIDGKTVFIDYGARRPAFNWNPQPKPETTE